jgi:hypothetical protein
MADTLLNSQKTRLFASDIFGMSEAFLSLLKGVNIDDSVVAVVPYQPLQTVLKMKLKRINAFNVMAGLMLILRV